MVHNLDVSRGCTASRLRTIFPAGNSIVAQNLANRPLAGTEFFYQSLVEVILWNTTSNLTELYALPVSSLYQTFRNCQNLKRIGLMNVSSVTSYVNTFAGCSSLEYVWLLGLSKDVSFADSLLLEKSCVTYIIESSTPQAAITITLHPDVYASLSNDADVIAALEAQPLVSLVSA